MTLEEFNALSPSEADAALLDCCGCVRWGAEVSAQRPFADMNQLSQAAESNWRTMTRDEWLEAFSHHPQIGDRPSTGSESHRRWSEGEQSSARGADASIKDRLNRGNRAYLEKFGYICMICATGKSAEEMLALLEKRLQNDPVDELPNAAEQQRQISRLRLKKLFASEQIS